MKCPRCAKETEFQGNPFRPFCSEECKMIDLGQWAGGHYRIPVLEELPEELHETDGTAEDDE